MVNMDDLTAMIGRDDATILEIGANGGEDTVRFLQAFPLANIYSFEPDPRAIARFLERLPDRANRLVRKAVGRATGVQTFHQSSGRPPNFDADAAKHGWPQDWDLSGSLRPPLRHRELHQWCKFETTIEVDVVSLDEWTRSNDIGEIDFIWADVQGGEMDLISGGGETLSRTRYFYTEYSKEELYKGSADVDQIVGLLPNFDVVRVFDHDVLLKNKEIADLARV